MLTTSKSQTIRISDYASVTIGMEDPHFDTLWYKCRRGRKLSKRSLRELENERAVFKTMMNIAAECERLTGEDLSEVKIFLGSVLQCNERELHLDSENVQDKTIPSLVTQGLYLTQVRERQHAEK